MKRWLTFFTIVLLCVMVAQPASASLIQGGVFEEDPPPDDLNGSMPSIYLPMVMSSSTSYRVSGHIKDSNDQPIQGATVTSDRGQSTVSDQNGVYAMMVPNGERQLTATKDDQPLDPEPAWVRMDGDHNNVNFSEAAACVNPIPNPSFEIVPLYWNPISGSANGYTPSYSSATAHTGLYSGYTGIPDGYLNVVSWSRWRSHEIYIPADATSATVSFWYYPKSTSGLFSTEGEVPDLTGLNADAENQIMAADFQYMYATDVNNNYLGEIMSTQSNAQAWTASGTISLMGYAGRWIKLEFGTYNDGIHGVTSAFFDDVVVEVCDGVTPSGCYSALVNSTFEAASGWTIRGATTPSSYSNTYWYSPITSMLSGIPKGVLPPAYGEWRTSEFYQEVTIPANAISANLQVRLLPTSSDLYGYHIAEQQALDEMMSSEDAPNAAESQYGYVCTNCNNPTNPTELALLFRWFPIDSYYWLFREFNLLRFRGMTVGILFGAQDFGDWGNTALYVDDAILTICTP